MKYLYPYECEKKGMSTPTELQAAIDGNRREGRRSSYGQFDTQMQTQLQSQLQSQLHQMVRHNTGDEIVNIYREKRYTKTLEPKT